MKNQETNPQKVLRLRKKAGLTRKELAERMGLRAWDIDRVESGRNGGSRSQKAINYLEWYLEKLQDPIDLDLSESKQPVVLIPPTDLNIPLTQQKYEERERTCTF